MQKKESQVLALIMAGGKGTRFWPESTAKKPKQYLNLFSENTLLNETCLRFKDFLNKEEIFVVTTKEQEELCRASTDQMINHDGIIFEPEGRNTAPCIFLSLLSLIDKGASDDDVVVIVPSDHVILNHHGFKSTILNAVQFSKINQRIVTIGITPHFPHTGFGYIEKGEMVDAEAFQVVRFKEKPHFELAKEYVSSGKFLWNAGMFVAPISVLMDEFRKHAPDMFDYKDQILNHLKNKTDLKNLYQKLKEDSFDYALMEKSDKVSVIPAQFDWNDLGSWDALASVIPEKNTNTVVKSDGEIFLNSTENVIFAPGKFVALIDMDKHVIVVNEKVVLVAPIEKSQEVKRIVAELKVTRPDLI